MKRFLILLSLIAFMFVACCSNVSAQTTTTKSGDPLSYMTSEQRLAYEADLKLTELQNIKNLEIKQLEKKLETYGNWVGVGGEVGTAINEGLSAVVDVADKFDGTDVGKFTMVLVAWKVVGKDVVKIILGLIFIIIFTWLLIFSFKRTCLDLRILTENTNPGFWKYPKVKKYEVIEPLLSDGDGLGVIRILHVVLFLIGIWITYGIMF